MKRGRRTRKGGSLRKWAGRTMRGLLMSKLKGMSPMVKSLIGNAMRQRAGMGLTRSGGSLRRAGMGLTRTGGCRIR